MPNHSDHVLSYLMNEREELERQLTRVNAAITGYQNGSQTKEKSLGARPPIEDICAFLEDNEGPQPQNTIIQVVGDRRKQLYPDLRNAYEGVWRALEYHVRYKRRIACVDPDTGLEVELKPIPARNLRKLPNAPESYKQDNWFQLLYKQEEKSPPVKRHRAEEAEAGN